MGQTLDNGIYLPSEGERNCYEGLAGNWVALDNHLGSTNIHVTINDKQAWNSHVADTTIHVTSADKQTWNSHVADTTIHVTSADKQTWNSHVADTTIHVTSADKQAWNGHVADTTIHVTSADKQAWNGKQDALSQTQLDAVNSGIDSTKVQQIATNTSDISSLQSGKANDSDVVHKSGNETVGGKKTFSDDLTIYNNDSSQNTKNLNIISSKIQVGDTSNSDAFGIRFNAGLSYVSRIMAFKDTSGTQNLQFGVRTKDSSNNFIGAMIRLRSYANGFNSFESDGDNLVSLGSSLNKWSNVQTYKVNNLEPSSLSLPSGNASDVIDISSYITALDGTSNSYTVPANGWISIAVVGTAIAIVSSSWSDSRLRESSGNVRMLYPVLKNETLGISVIGTTLTYARFIPCQGNV